ncbi:MAG: zinc ABC transporter substrate-binding protein [Gammaproteobacteria bacterium]|nr:zinc ABC transporter substrate-binding protein [Gammaproteobacteria bacterium]
MFRRLLCILVVLAFSPGSFANVNVVVTIKPLQLIAQSIIGDAGSVKVLMAPGNSPHHYSLSPSDRIAMESADLIVYVGEELETQLDSVMGQIGSRKNVLKLLDLETLVKIPLDGDGPAAQHQRYNPHIWLNSNNGIIIAEAIRDRLIKIDSAKAAEYSNNFSHFSNRLVNLEEQWHSRLLSASTGPYVVYHDAFSYFESQFGLGHGLALVVDPEIQPGIRQILNVRKEISAIQPVCIFTDVSASEATINTMLSGYQLNSVQLDLLGKNLGETQGYEQLLDNLVSDFINCFQARSH